MLRFCSRKAVYLAPAISRRGLSPHFRKGIFPFVAKPRHTFLMSHTSGDELASFHEEAAAKAFLARLIAYRFQSISGGVDGDYVRSRR